MIRKLDWYLILAASSLAFTIPFAIAAIAHAKGAEVGSGWFFTVFPGIGLAVCGTAGNAIVVGAAMNLKMSRLARAFLFSTAGISFVAMFVVIPVYLYARYTERTLVEAIHAAQEDPLGFAWFVLLLVMVEFQASALVVVSGAKTAERLEAEAKVAAGLRAADEVAHESRATTPVKILTALANQDRQTAADLLSATGVRSQATIGKHLKALEADSRIHGVHDINRGAKVWSLGAAHQP